MGGSSIFLVARGLRIFRNFRMLRLLRIFKVGKLIKSLAAVYKIISRSGYVASTYLCSGMIEILVKILCIYGNTIVYLCVYEFSSLKNCGYISLLLFLFMFIFSLLGMKVICKHISMGYYLCVQPFYMW